MTDKPFDYEEYSRERLRQTTPGAGEGERWEKQNVKETMAGTIAELHIPSYSKFGWQLPEWLVDLICTLHTERTHLVSRDAYVEMRDAREADQQTIADLRAQVDAAWLTANLNHEKAVAYDIAVEESGSGTYHLRDWVREQAQTIAELEDGLNELRERAEKAEGMVQWWKEEARHMEDVLQAEREKSAALHQRFAEAVQAKEKLEREK